MHLRAISLAQLMRESEHCIELAASSGLPHEQLIADRILSDPGMWCRWESEHYMIVRKVAAQASAVHQSTALKSASFALIHRKALFEYLRDRQLRGEARQRVVQFFQRSRTYSDAVVTEHGRYLRGAASFLCAGHLGSRVINDGAFEEPLLRYEELYTEYFGAYFDAELACGDDAEASSQRFLLPHLKQRLREQREAVLALPRLTPGLRRDQEFQRATGDTQKLRALVS